MGMFMAGFFELLWVPRFMSTSFKVMPGLHTHMLLHQLQVTHVHENVCTSVVALLRCSVCEQA